MCLYGRKKRQDPIALCGKTESGRPRMKNNDKKNKGELGRRKKWIDVIDARQLPKF